MINTVVLTGRPVKEIELKTLESGTKVAGFTLAVNRSFKDRNGDYPTDFINIQTFEKTAEFVSNYVKKGELVGVEGRLQQRVFQNKDGVNVYVIEVVANQITLLTPKGSSEVEPKLFSEPAKEVVKDKDWANAEYKKRTKGVNSVVKREEIKKQIELEMDDNLPF